MDLAKVKEQKQMVKQEQSVREEKKELRWPDDYYSVTDGIKRREMLEQAVSQGLETEDAELRRTLWERRYGIKEGVDQLLAAWVNLNYYSNMGRNKRIGGWHKKEVSKLIESLSFDLVEQYGAAGRELLYLEFYHMLDFYIGICQTDKKYSGLILGLGTMSKERLIEKIAKEFFRVIYCVPEMISGIAEYEIIKQAACDCFAARFPNKANAIECLAADAGFEVKE